MHLVMIKLMVEKRDVLISRIKGGGSGRPLLFSRKVLMEKMHLVMLKLMMKKDELISRKKGVALALN